MKQDFFEKADNWFEKQPIWLRLSINTLFGAVLFGLFYTVVLVSI